MVFLSKCRLGLALVLALAVFGIFSEESVAWDLGDSIQPRLRNGRSPRTKGKSSTATSLLTIGGHGFSNYIYPTLNYERSIASWISVGVTGLYSKSSEGGAQALHYGGYGHLNIYIGSSGFRGLWLHGAYGAWTIEAKANGDTERIFRTVAMATIGFRGAIENTLRLGIAGGLLHLSPGTINSRLLNVEIRDTVPVAIFEIGFGF